MRYVGWIDEVWCGWWGMRGEGRAREGDVGGRVHQLSVHGRGWGWRRSGGAVG